MERLKDYYTQQAAILIDVRQPDEYEKGHIPGARSIPLQKLRDFSLEVTDKDTPIYVYCLSGARSARAVRALRGVGFTAVTDLGGISSYQGELEK
ncbi:MAG: rhodanese-like domain-containing protein [Clostridia bacterium]|nr:rhodanese-like domain-containing protein [Clostridia bacterium]MBP3588268.1 rhodanese-like domain-containing protein [Clostridia bacterium]